MKTQVDIDDDLLEAARRELGTTTKKETIHEAFRFVLARREQARTQVQFLADYWGTDITDPDVMAQARR